MIRKLLNGDIDRVADIWLKTNLKAHYFISNQYWKSNYELVKEMMSQSEVYVFEADKGKTSKEVRLEANAASIYITSVNGIAESGEIVNIDGNCNRVASIFYGHEKVYFVIGENKIEKDYDSALYRARNIAAPLNAQRLGVKTPCAIKADKCYDCKSPERICRGLSVLWEKPMTGEFEIILIHENLGY